MSYRDMREGQLMIWAGQGDESAKAELHRRREQRAADYRQWAARNPGRPASAWA